MATNPPEPRVPISREGTDAENNDQQSNSAECDDHADLPPDVISPTGTFPALDESQEDSLEADPAVRGSANEVDSNTLKFQLIPISETPGKNAVGEVVERVLKEGDVIKLGRLIVRDGQTTIKGKKPATEIDVWFTSKVVSRLHAEIWAKDGQLVLKDVGSSSGTFLNKTRLSPNGKESGPYPLKNDDIIQFGVDFKGKNDSDDNYRAVTMKIGFFDQSWLKAQKSNANPQKYSFITRFTDGLKQMLAASNPYGANSSELTGDDVDCCICISNITPFQALFIAPCSHVFHFKCVGTIIYKSPMFQCPLCRQVANLTASVSCESLNEPSKHPPALPMLESEAQPVVSPANNPPQWRNERRDSRTSRSSRNARRHSLKLEGKKLLQNLGIIKAKNPSSSLTPGERAVSPVDNQTVDEDKKKDKKRNFSFGMSKKDKEKKDAIPRGLEHIGEPSNAGARDAPTPNAAQAEQPKPSAVNTAKPAK